MPTPAQILDFRSWKLTLPVGPKESPTEVTSKALQAGFEHPPYFRGQGSAAVFRAPVNGVSTSGSNNPRSELREMKPDGITKAAWSSAKGYHRLAVDMAFTRLPSGKDGCGLVAAQIHGASDDVTVFRLEREKLWVTLGDSRKDWQVVKTDYRIGTRILLEFIVWQGKVEAWVDGNLVRTTTKNFSGGYFKAGAYSQINAGASPMSAENYGETAIYSLTVEHSDKPPLLPPKHSQTTGSVVIIRHAEKPDDPDSHDLSEAGRRRAEALVGFFTAPGVIRPTWIFASKGETASERMVQTALPLAHELGLTVDTRFDSERQVDETARLLADKALAGETVLAVLEHSAIPEVASDLAEMLGAAQPPGDWPDTDYSSVWVLADGRWGMTSQGAVSSPGGPPASFTVRFDWDGTKYVGTQVS